MWKKLGVFSSVVLLVCGAALGYVIWNYWPESRPLIRAVHPFVWISLAGLGALLAAIPVAQYILVPMLKRVPGLRMLVSTPSSRPATVACSKEHAVRLQLAENESTHALQVMSKLAPAVKG